MRKLRIVAVVAGLAAALLVITAVAYGQALPRPETWVDGERFGGVVTPATFDPANGNFDELYMNPSGFKNGVNLISESKPGDADYNGGRWHLNVLKAGVNPAKYAQACALEHLDPRDFESTDKYFVCPLLPRNDLP